jgi:hypothetical protein
MDKIHYYDGEIYRVLIDPNLSGLRQKILRILRDVINSSTLVAELVHL